MLHRQNFFYNAQRLEENRWLWSLLPVYFCSTAKDRRYASESLSVFLVTAHKNCRRRRKESLTLARFLKEIRASPSAVLSKDEFVNKLLKERAGERENRSSMHVFG